MSKILQEIVLDLGRKVDTGFEKIDAKFEEVKDSIHGLDLRLRDQQNAIITHTYADTAANKRVDKLESRVSVLESMPVKYAKKALNGFVMLIGIISTLLGIAWSIRNFF